MAERIRAPEIDPGLTWLNVDQPTPLRELRGAVVLLHFWTYGCASCRHVLRVLRAIEERYRDAPVVVIGVHSGKFDAELDHDRIDDAIQKYEVEHPVVVDDRMVTWKSYAIRSWPTLVVIRPDGTIAAVAPGEPDIDVLVEFIERELALAEADGTLDEGPIAPERPTQIWDSGLRYPGKASVLPDGRIAVSDSGYHRVLLCEADGQVEAAIGSGMRGLADGLMADAAFDDPQGTCFLDGALYVADAGNHALRRVDLARGAVTTVAGTGRLGRTMPMRRVQGTSIALRSPWDVAVSGGAIYVAMAGGHQIWRFFPGPDEIEVFAGTGTRALVDGAANESAWGQPSGLCARGGVLYVADSDASAVRAIDLASREVRTLVGEGLLEFGDRDGAAASARLQHPLGVAATDEGVLVADAYNGKIKRVSDPRGEVWTLLEGLHEPGSVAVAPDGAWIVADTNAHRLLRVAGGEERAIDVRGMPTPARGSVAHDAPALVAPPSSRRAEGWFTSLLTLEDGIGLAPGAGEIVLDLRAVRGTELPAGSMIQAAVRVSRRPDLLRLTERIVRVEAAGGPAQEVRIPVVVTAPLPEAVVEAELIAAIDYVACDPGNRGACVPGEIHARIPARLLAEGGVMKISFVLALS